MPNNQDNIEPPANAVRSGDVLCDGAVKRIDMAEPLRWIAECAVCKTRYENGCGSTECCGSVQYIVREARSHSDMDEGRRTQEIETTTDAL